MYAGAVTEWQCGRQAVAVVEWHTSSGKHAVAAPEWQKYSGSKKANAISNCSDPEALLRPLLQTSRQTSSTLLYFSEIWVMIDIKIQRSQKLALKCASLILGSLDGGLKTTMTSPEIADPSEVSWFTSGNCRLMYVHLY